MRMELRRFADVGREEYEEIFDLLHLCRGSIRREIISLTHSSPFSLHFYLLSAPANLACLCLLRLSCLARFLPLFLVFPLPPQLCKSGVLRPPKASAAAAHPYIQGYIYP
jgi:hypothetical protein